MSANVVDFKKQDNEIVKVFGLVLDPREMKELNFARMYVREFNHGTPGHLAYSLIAKLAETLEEIGVVLITEEG